MSSPRQGSNPSSPIKKIAEQPLEIDEDKETISYFLQDHPNEKMTLGFIWNMVLTKSVTGDAPLSSPRRRHITKKKTSTRPPDELVVWAMERVQDYKCIDKNFRPACLALLALLDTFYPEKINYDNIEPNNKEGNRKFLVESLKELNVPVCVWENENYNTIPARKSVLAQIASIKAYLAPDSSFLSSLSPRDLGSFNDSDINSNNNNNNNSNENENENANSVNSNDNDNDNNSNENQNDNDNNENEDHSEVEIEDDGGLEIIHIGDIVARNAQLFEFNKLDGDNSDYDGRQFVMTMEIEGQTRGLVLVQGTPFLNPSGLRLVLSEPDDSSKLQHFVFGKSEWNTVIDSVAQRGMVWDVADRDNCDPPEGTPFYMFPFHGRHNQHFIYQDEMIYAQQNGQVVTYVGGEQPFVMRLPSPELKEQQTFYIKLL